MTIKEDSPYKIKPDDHSADTSLKEEEGWHKMDVRWLITDKSAARPRRSSAARRCRRA